MTATLNQDLPQAVNDFFAKEIPEPFQILGLKLLPLSIGRYRRMARLGIGFVSESESSADGKDLLIGILICSMTCSEWDEISASRECPAIVKDWMKKIHACPPWYLRGGFGRIISSTFIGRHWRKNHTFDLLAKIRLFRQYVDEAQSVPKFLRKNETSGFSTAHWTANIESVLMGELNWSHEDIDELPLSRALSVYFNFMENQGLITILTDADYQQMQKNTASIEAALADFKAKGGVI